MTDPKVIKDKDGDRWTAIVDGDRFGGFGSEEAAQRFVRRFAYGDLTTTVAEEITEYQRTMPVLKMELERLRAAGGDPHDPGKIARLERSIALTEEGYQERIMDAADDESNVRKN